MQLDACTLDLDRHEVDRDGQTDTLTPMETALLRYLAARPGQAVGQEELLREVWGYAAGVHSRTVRNTVRRLRVKVEADPSNPRHVCTVRGAGYCFEPRLDVAPVAAPPGREELVVRVRGLLRRSGLVTLIGPGGVGKTTLARAVAGEATWVDLAAVATADGLVGAAASSLGAADVGQALVARGQQLVLDNADQLDLTSTRGEPVASWVAAGATVLATSRAPIGVAGERLVRVPPLPTDVAVEVFRARAAALDVPLEADHDALAQLVDRLDGLPLAVELAASRLGVLSVPQLSARLGLDLLRAPAGSSARHPSMRDSLQASWDLLTAREREALGACSTFQGGFDLDAAEAVVGPDALDLLDVLQRRSLLRVTGATRRYGLLELVRAFAAEHRPADAIQRHAAHYLEEGARWVRQAYGSQAAEARAWMVREFDNLVAVWRRGTGDRVAQALAAIEPIVVERHPHGTLLELAERAVAEAVGDVAWVQARCTLARALCGVGRFDAAEGVLDAARQRTSAPDLVGRVANARGALAVWRRRPAEAVSHYQLALEAHERGLDQVAIGSTLGRMGNALFASGELDEGRATLRRALATHRAVGNRTNEANVSLNLVYASFFERPYEVDLAELKVGLDLARAAGSHRVVASGLQKLMQLHAHHGHDDRALEAAEERLQLLRQAGQALAADEAMVERLRAASHGLPTGAENGTP